MFRHMVAILFLAAVASSQNERNTRQLFRDGQRGGPSKPETMFGRYGRSSASEESIRDESSELDPKAISGLNAQQRSGVVGLSGSYGVPLGAPNFGPDVVNNVIASKSSGLGLAAGHSPELVLGAGFSKYGSCGNGLERTIYGKCVPPLVSQDLYIYKAPSYKVPYEPVHYEHKPKVHLNFVFIKSPSIEGGHPHPVVVPPPRQKTHVYLLSKKPHERHQQVIEVPHNNEKPEVYFVGYKDGDNPVLPGGIDLKTALSQAAQPGDGHALGYGGGALIDAGHGSGAGLGLGVSSLGSGAHGHDVGSFSQEHDDGSFSLGHDDGNFAQGHDDGSFSQVHGGSIGVDVGSGGFSGGVVGSVGGGFSSGLYSGGHDDGSFSLGHGGGSFSHGQKGSVSLGHGGGSFSHGQKGSVSLGHGGGSFSHVQKGSVSLGHGGGSFSHGQKGSVSLGHGGGSVSLGHGGGGFSRGKGASVSLIGHDGGSFSQGINGGFSGGVGGGHGGGFLDYGEAFDLSGGVAGGTVDDLILDIGKGKGGFKNAGFRDGLEAALANDDIDEIIIDHGIQDVGKPKLVTEVVGSLHDGGGGLGSLHGVGVHGGSSSGGFFGGHEAGHRPSRSFGGIGHSRHDVSSSSGFGEKSTGGGATAHVEGVGMFTGGKGFGRGGFGGSFDDSLEDFQKRGGSVLKANKFVLKGV